MKLYGLACIMPFYPNSETYSFSADKERLYGLAYIVLEDDSNKEYYKIKIDNNFKDQPKISVEKINKIDIAEIEESLNKDINIEKYKSIFYPINDFYIDTKSGNRIKWKEYSEQNQNWISFILEQKDDYTIDIILDDYYYETGNINNVSKQDILLRIESY